MLYLKFLIYMYTYSLRKVWSSFAAEDLFVQQMGSTASSGSTSFKNSGHNKLIELTKANEQQKPSGKAGKAIQAVSF